MSERHANIWRRARTRTRWTGSGSFMLAGAFITSRNKNSAVQERGFQKGDKRSVWAAALFHGEADRFTWKQPALFVKSVLGWNDQKQKEPENHGGEDGEVTGWFCNLLPTDVSLRWWFLLGDFNSYRDELPPVDVQIYRSLFLSWARPSLLLLLPEPALCSQRCLGGLPPTGGRLVRCSSSPDLDFITVSFTPVLWTCIC